MKIKQKSDVASKVIADVNEIRQATITQSAKKISSYFKAISQGQENDEDQILTDDQEDISIDDLLNGDDQQMQMDDTDYQGQIDDDSPIQTQYDADQDGEIEAIEVDDQGDFDPQTLQPLQDQNMDDEIQPEQDSEEIEFSDEQRKLAQNFDEQDINQDDEQSEQDDELVIEIEDDTEQTQGCEGQTCNAEQLRKMQQSYKRKLHMAGKKIKALQQSNTKLKQQYSKASKTLKVLNYKLQEIKLFNKKMQYVNQIFSKYALSKIQKQSVLDMFDKAQDVKQAKLVFESFVKTMTPQSKKGLRTQSISSKTTKIQPKKLTQSAQKRTENRVDEQIDQQFVAKMRKRIGVK